MKIKRGDIAQLKQVLLNCGNLQGKKFYYMWDRNLKLINAEEKKIEKYVTPFRPEQTKELNTYGMASGKLDSQLQRGAISEENYNSELAKLKETYPKEYEASKKFIDDITPHMLEVIDIPFYVLKVQDVPKEITANMRKSIEIFVEEE
jgi:esterase/lipase